MRRAKVYMEHSLTHPDLLTPYSFEVYNLIISKWERDLIWLGGNVQMRCKEEKSQKKKQIKIYNDNFPNVSHIGMQITEQFTSNL